MDPVSSASSALSHYQQLLDVSSQALAEGHVLPEVISAQEIAEVQIEAQTHLLKESLEAETQILDLLV